MRTEPKTLAEFETMYADRLAKDIATTEGHIVKLTNRLDAETDKSEKTRLAALVELHTNHRTGLLNTDSKIAAANAKAEYDERVSKLPSAPIKPIMDSLVVSQLTISEGSATITDNA